MTAMGTAVDGVRVRVRVSQGAKMFIPVGQRERLLDAVGKIVAVDGLGALNHRRISAVAGMSGRTFYDLFADMDECVLALMERSLDEITEVVVPAYAAKPGTAWPERVRAGLSALLCYLDERPGVARLMIVESMNAGSGISERRVEVLDLLAHVVDEGRLDSKGGRRAQQPPPLTAEMVVGGVLSILQAHISRRMAGLVEGSLSERLNPLVASVVLPYRGYAAADRELGRRVVSRRVSAKQSPVGRGDGWAWEKESPHGVLRLTNRTVAVLTAIADHPGSSSRRIAKEAGITDEGQASKLLAKLARHGLIENTSQPKARGEAYAWYLTGSGEEVVRDAHAGEGAKARRVRISNRGMGTHGA